MDALVAENSAPRHRYLALHAFFALSHFHSDAFRRLDNHLVSRKTMNGAFRYDVCPLFVP